MNTDTKDLLPKITNLLKINSKDILGSFDKEYPECLCLVVLKDVNPEDMEKVCELLRTEGGGEMRLCAQIIEEEMSFRFDGLDFESAWEESWNCCIATIRMG